MKCAELDYYNVLNIPRNATKEDILKSYRKLAIKLFPYRDSQLIRDISGKDTDHISTHMSPLPIYRQWEYINMACDILGHDFRRSIYDRFGESALLKGIRLKDGYFPPYQYHGNHMKVYHDIFGKYSPYSDIIDSILVSSTPLIDNKTNGIGYRAKDPPIIKQIPLELEDVYFGCVKLMHVWREELVNAKDFRTEKLKKSLTLNIPPGVTAGTRFCFDEEGDRGPNKIPADIIFIVADAPHRRFQRRNQHDLIYVHEINLCQALTGFQFLVRTVDKRDLKISISEVVNPGFVKIVNGEGLPKCKSLDIVEARVPCRVAPKEHGDLIIEFKIYLTKEMKQLARRFFTELSSDESKETSKNCI
ncbi:dnaJ homolog subfamily B member 13-like isoform X2 [Musca domestica]|uniref:DnaJ homolog subfamily B member 13-like isoform X2 n=1 Tax=Musca domestica TaxID=7370 RepID=A0ABM3UZ27_MUSDO|nr:dnaJ homolog subfamily B member 13-like isoform X2 [Musca domestica]XP_058978793.1 dnaJ homolog subfamily B member 13-like isoform X2 [Musca domestica]